MSDGFCANGAEVIIFPTQPGGGGGVRLLKKY